MRPQTCPGSFGHPRVAPDARGCPTRNEKIEELERQFDELSLKLRSASRDKRDLEKRLLEILGRRRAQLADPPGQLKLFLNESEMTEETPPDAKEAPDGETANDPTKQRRESPTT